LFNGSGQPAVVDMIGSHSYMFHSLPPDSEGAATVPNLYVQQIRQGGPCLHGIVP
jgi:hypothetical protein